MGGDMEQKLIKLSSDRHINSEHVYFSVLISELILTMVTAAHYCATIILNQVVRIYAEQTYENTLLLYALRRMFDYCVCE